jgi:hypothetical protein
MGVITDSSSVNSTYTWYSISYFIVNIYSQLEAASFANVVWKAVNQCHLVKP